MEANRRAPAVECVAKIEPSEGGIRNGFRRGVAPNFLEMSAREDAPVGGELSQFVRCLSKVRAWRLHPSPEPAVRQRLPVEVPRLWRSSFCQACCPDSGPDGGTDSCPDSCTGLQLTSWARRGESRTAGHRSRQTGIWSAGVPGSPKNPLALAFKVCWWRRHSEMVLLKLLPPGLGALRSQLTSRVILVPQSSRFVAASIASRMFSCDASVEL